MPDYTMSQSWRLGRVTDQGPIRAEVRLWPKPKYGLWNNGRDANTPQEWNANLDVQMPDQISEHTVAAVSLKDRKTGQAAAHWLVERTQQICEDGVAPDREEVEAELAEHLNTRR